MSVKMIFAVLMVLSTIHVAGMTNEQQRLYNERNERLEQLLALKSVVLCCLRSVEVCEAVSNPLRCLQTSGQDQDRLLYSSKVATRQNSAPVIDKRSGKSFGLCCCFSSESDDE